MTQTPGILRILLRFPRILGMALVRVYQWFLSPMLHALAGPGSGCRFEPSCSRYALDALWQHGLMKGGWLTLKRIMRCHPWGGCGCDPVPRKFHWHAPRKAPSKSPGSLS